MLTILLGQSYPGRGSDAGIKWITAGLTTKFAMLLLLLLAAADAGRVWGLDARPEAGAGSGASGVVEARSARPLERRAERGEG